MRSHHSFLWSLALALLISVFSVNAADNSRDSNIPAVMNHQAIPLKSRSENTKQIADSVTNLAAKIALALTSSKSKTEIISPVSIAGALSLLLLGSGGETQKELLRVMGLDTLPLSFQDIHVSFGRLLQDLLTNDPSLEPLVTWNGDVKCIQHVDWKDYYEDFVTKTPINPNDSQLKSLSNNLQSIHFIYSNDFQIKIVNGLFAEKQMTIGRQYEQLVKDLYQSEFQHLDFSGNETGSVRYINNWIHTQTHGRIADIVSHINPDTILMIVNTLYFRGLWEEPFQPLAIPNHRFFPNGPDGPDSIDIPMMAKSHCMPYYHWQEENVRVIGVPYRQNVTMYIFMPINSTRELVQTLQSKLSTEQINEIVMKMDMTLVTLLFPRMHLSNSISLKNVLQQLGVYRLFDSSTHDLFRPHWWYIDDGEDTVDLLDVLQDTRENAEHYLRKYHPNCTIVEKRGIGRGNCLKHECVWGAQSCICCDEHDGEDDTRHGRHRRYTVNSMMLPKNYTVFLDEMFHKVDLTVNERGTEGGTLGETFKHPPDQINFVVNGPFFMMIREETTRLPLFYGNVYNPK